MNTLLDQAYARAVSENFLYSRYKDRYDFLLRSYMGGKEYRDGAYLIKYANEADGEYQKRLDITPVDNQCKSIISLYISFLFRTPPERELQTFEQIADVAALLEDADLDGRTMDHFMKEVATWSMVFGHVWVATVKPNTNAATRADELKQQVRPYLAVYSPLSVTDWRWRRETSGQYTLEMIKYTEEINDTEIAVKEWTETNIRTTIINLQNNRAESYIDEPNMLGRIPFVLCYAERSPVRGIGISVIGDIADQQRGIYNELSEVEQSIRLDSHPSLVATAETQLGVGAGAIIRMPESLDANLKPYVLDFTGAQVDKIYLSINNRQKMIDSMANVGSVRATESKEMSGFALETEFQLLNARLATMADNIELCEEQIWRWVGEYIGQPFTGTIKYPDSFAIRDTDRELRQLTTAAQTVTDPVKLEAIESEIMDVIAVSYDDPDEELPEGLDKEIYGRTYPSGEPISEYLPVAYQPAQGEENCSNCGYWQESLCSRWNMAKVKPIYWCRAWEPIAD